MNNLIRKFRQRERILIGIILLALEVAAFYHFLIKPQLNDIRRQQTELSGREELLEAKKSKLRLLNQLEKGRTVLKAQADEFRSQFFSFSDIYDFMERFIQYADENDSELIVVDYKHQKDTKNKIGKAKKRNVSDKKDKKRADAENNNISLQSVEVTIRGNYENLIKILSQFETYEKLTNIRDLRVIYSREEPDKLEAEVALELHSINDNDKKLSTPNKILSKNQGKTPSRRL